MRHDNVMPALERVIMQKLVQQKERMQRIRVGLSGLAGVVMLVGLANIVVDNARKKDDGGQLATSDKGSNLTTVVGGTTKPTEPLAELGVTPTADSGVVADLQPDPNLKEPLDRPPPVSSTLPPSQQRSPAQ